MGLSDWMLINRSKGGGTPICSVLAQAEDVDVCFLVACLCALSSHTSPCSSSPWGIPLALQGSKAMKNCSSYWKAKLYKSPLAISSGEKLKELHN